MPLPRRLSSRESLLLELFLDDNVAILKIIEVPERSQVGSYCNLYKICFSGLHKVHAEISTTRLPVRVIKLYSRRKKAGAGVDQTYVVKLERGSLRLTARAAKTTIAQRVPISEAKQDQEQRTR